MISGRDHCSRERTDTTKLTQVQYSILASFSTGANESRALFPYWSLAICKLTVDTPFLCSQLRKQRRICFSSSQFSFRFPTRFFSPLTARSSDEQFSRAESKWKFQTTVIPNRKRIPSYGSSSGCTVQFIFPFDACWLFSLYCVVHFSRPVGESDIRLVRLHDNPRADLWSR